MRAIFLAFLLAATLLGGCAVSPGLDPRSNYADVGDGAIIVMGVSPEVELQIFKGDVTPEQWVRDAWAASLISAPRRGYIVARVDAAENERRYGIAGLVMRVGPQPYMFLPCDGDQVFTFEAPRGKVVYVGDVRMRDPRGDMDLDASYDLERARAYMAAYFPLVADRLEPGRHDHMKLKLKGKYALVCRADALK